MTDWSQYVGIPFVDGGRDRDGCDCYGLVRLILRAEYGIDLPAYADGAVCAHERAEVAALFDLDRQTGPWVPVTRAQAGDVVLLRVDGHPAHLGLAVDHCRMIHTRADQSKVEPYTGRLWRDRIAGLYRHQALIDPTPVTLITGVPDIRRQTVEVALPNPTLAQIVAKVARDLPKDRLRVVLSTKAGAWHVPACDWPRTRPTRGTVVTLRLVPGDGGISAALIALQNFSIQVGAAAASLGFVSGTTGIFAVASFVNSAIIAGITSLALGSLAAALVPPLPKFGTRRDPEDLYQIDGWGNRLAPGEAFPYPFGRTRMSPVLAQPPASEIEDEEQYVRALMIFGHGRLQISDLRLGDTPITEFPDIETEVREGTASDTAVTLVTEQVKEDRLGVELEPVTGGITDYHIWTTPAAVDRARVILQWPSGLIRFVDSDERDTTVHLRIEYRAAGASTWVTFDQTVMTVTRTTLDPFFLQVEFPFPSRGAYEVRINRSDDYQSSAKIFNRTIWVTAAAIVQRPPIGYDGPLALIAVRAKASKLANGQLEALNAVVHRYCDAWDGSAWVANQLPLNSAATFLDVLRAPAGYKPQADADIDLAGLGDWYTFCASRSLSASGIFGGDQDLGEALARIAATGRASWRRDGGGWGVVIDRAQDIVADRISPRNASDLSWKRGYNDNPDAFLVEFRDATSDYERAERVVPWPGFVGDPQTFEALPMDGATDPAVVWVEARRRQYEVIHRPDTFTAYQDGTVRVAERGDVVALSWDMLDEVQVASRVRSVTGRLVELEAPVAMQAGTSYGLRWQAYTEADTVGDTVEAAVITVAGESTALALAAGASVPPVGRLVHFGTVAQLEFLCQVTRIEPAQDLGVVLTMVNAAPQIDTLTDAEVAPAWDRQPRDATATSGVPDTPVIGTLVASAPEYDYTPGSDLQVTVPVSAGLTVPVARIDVSHRAGSAGAYTVTSLGTNSGYVVLTYARDTAIEVFATTVSVHGVSSAASATETFTVTGAAATLPTALDLGSMSAVGGLGAATLSLATNADTTEVQLFRVATGVTLDPDAHQVGVPVAVIASTTITRVEGDNTRADMIDDGTFDTGTPWTAGGGWTIATGTATHTTGTASTLSQTLSLTAGTTYRGQIVVSGRTAGSVTVQLAGGTPVAHSALSADGTHLFALDAVSGNDRIEVVATSDFDGTVDDVVLYPASATSVPQGVWDYYAAPINAQRIANSPTGPVSVTII